MAAANLPEIARLQKLFSIYICFASTIRSSRLGQLASAAEFQLSHLDRAAISEGSPRHIPRCLDPIELLHSCSFCARGSTVTAANRSIARSPMTHDSHRRFFVVLVPFQTTLADSFAASRSRVSAIADNRGVNINSLEKCLRSRLWRRDKNEKKKREREREERTRQMLPRREDRRGDSRGRKNAHLPTCAHNDHGCDYRQLPLRSAEIERRGGGEERGGGHERSAERWIFAMRRDAE